MTKLRLLAILVAAAVLGFFGFMIAAHGLSGLGEAFDEEPRLMTAMFVGLAGVALGISRPRLGGLVAIIGYAAFCGFDGNLHLDWFATILVAGLLHLLSAGGGSTRAGDQRG